MDVAALKQQALAEIDAHAAELIALSLRIHAQPELAFNEHRAAGWLADFLDGQGFEVARGIVEMPTAFRAVAGSGAPTIAILAEYDALPGIGHGCGHNVIATTAVGAGVGVRAVIEQLGGSVQVIGTPAEELYGGKAQMIRGGAFAGIDATIMTHPATRDAVMVKALACAELTVEYHGREAHASAQPERGINALEALLLAFSSINALRQHIRQGGQMHGVITDGGEAPNIVPAHSSASFLVRAEDDAYLEELKLKVAACFEAGAMATGATLDLRWNANQYGAMVTNAALAEAHRLNLAQLGRSVAPEEAGRGLGSTDMGNVSSIMPGIHPMIAVAPPHVNIHSPEFAEHAASEAGQRAVIDGAKALAMTAIDFLADAGLRQRARDEFERWRAATQAP